MFQRIVFQLACALVLCLGLAAAALAAEPPQDQRKHTALGKYVTAAEAYDLWQKGGGKVAIVDVRTPEEYEFVGHPPMSPNIPAQLRLGGPGAGKQDMPLADNPAFVDLMKQRFKPGDAIVIMCRSGYRSALAARKLIAAGFTNVYNMVDGFEGDTVADKASKDFGKRSLNGWRNSNLPWTNDLDAKLIYQPKK
ncbi:MAG: rhodanese-like domain-containing protein [Humidesulfovibrio sp.]|jgi:rhodanese-related sulfurtransferase|uniref:rhodanese-like domain-containing protein n=1 Tax=Humidesulfovibrio sp. TaxID=2910988 RepID=UPI00273287F4|nr:rhodanese-like domain-containing protein [Humidesulfovibrio sp.]MDP2847286.1 rhodanese-like domain-containing protein [Humidesulfovibrio sp.]